MTQRVIDSLGNHTIVMTYDGYLEYCKRLGIPALLDQQTYELGIEHMNPLYPLRKTNEIYALQELIISAWKYSRFMNKEHMQFYYAMNEMLWDKWKSLQ